MINRIPNTQAVERLIKESIHSGEFQRGSKLPPERTFVERFGVSRTAIREAMKSLQAQGIVVVRHGYGTYVCEDFGHFLALPMSNLLEMGDISVKETMYVRELFEPSLAAYAAEHRSDAQAEELLQLEEAMTRTVGDPYAYEELDAEFHRAIAAITGNRLIVQILESIRGILRAQIHALVNDAQRLGAEYRHDEHNLIGKAIRQQDAEAARAAMQQHLKSSTALMLALPNSPGDTHTR
jgi:GntR family transcriptional regulator, transcriptional repressor for pyruvate dehydrogenase complex